MRPSNLFLATIFLMSVGLLFLFGLSTLGPLYSPKPAPGAANGDATLTQLTAPKVDFVNPARGAAEPDLTIVEYGDHRCEPCAAMEQDLGRILQAYPDRIRVVWKDLPNEASHPDATAAAIAARCAGLQEAFWPYHALLLENQGATGTENHVAMAAQAGLDANSFRSCLESEATKPLVMRDIQEAMALRVDATPYLFIGDRRVSGAVGYDQLRTVVESVLAVEDATETESPGAVESQP